MKLELIGIEKANVVQDIYNQSPIYFRRVDGTDPLPGMGEKDILDVPPKRSSDYLKVPLLIYEDSQPVGYADLHINYRSIGIAYMGLLILKETLQSKGLGRRAYFEVENYLKSNYGIEKIYLGVSNHNQVQGYWEKMGFIPNGFTYKWAGGKIESTVTEMEKIISEQKLRLERPSQTLFEEFNLFVDDMKAHGQTMWEPYLPKAEESAIQFVERLRAREAQPETPLVPETVYWATFDGHVVGRISLRHRLEGNLHKIGGHIGYEVSPKWRRRGFATEMLHLILQTDKAKEIGRLLLTCSPTNKASNKTITKNSGQFSKKVFVDFINEDRNHYWIEISAASNT